MSPAAADSTDPNPAHLDARVIRQIHPGLRLDAAIRLGAGCGVIFGPSGAGKTSLLRGIAGLERPDAGHVRLGDAVLFDAGAGVNRPLRDRRLGMIFQDDLLFPHLDVAANLGFGLRGWPRAEAADRTEAVAALCGVTHLLGRRPALLSGGERQRVGLARALAPRPRLLLCDEPVSALDLEARAELVGRLRAVQRAEAIPVLYVTHSPDEALALGDRLFRLDAGRVTAEGPPLEILAARDRPAGLGTMGNRFEAVVAGHDGDAGETALRLGGPEGPVLIVPLRDWPAGAAVAVTVDSDDILLAVGPLEGRLSARNRIAGRVERVLPHAAGTEAEVLVRTGPVVWVVSLGPAAVAALGLEPGVAVRLVIKARAARVRAGS